MGQSGWNSLWLLLPFMLAVAAIAVVSMVGRRLWRRKLKDILREPDNEPMHCGQCGYDVRGLDIPRCPECGCAFGFDRTFEELGLDEEEVRQRVRKRRQELSDNAQPPSDRH